MRRWATWGLRLVAGLVVIGGAGFASLDQDMRRLLLNLPTKPNVLFWSVPTRDAAFRATDRLTFIAKSREVATGAAARPLPVGDPLKLDADIANFMTGQRAAALVILHKGRVRLERYAMDFSANGRWTSFSVAKSVASTLVGAAIRDGHIKSLDDPVTAYITDLKGSAYDAVTVRQLLTMTSGVKWNENYSDPKSDVARFFTHKAPPGVIPTVDYMRKLERAAPPGTKWQYSTGETNLIGVLVSAATKKPLATYLSEKIWAPYGMEQKATWILDASGHEVSGCCLSAATRDFARFGQFILDGGKAGGKDVLPEGWIAAATTKQTEIGASGRGYGYQWWTNDDGSFLAQGIFGQAIFIDPKRQLVIAVNGNWPTSQGSGGEGAARRQFFASVQAAIDAGR